MRGRGQPDRWKFPGNEGQGPCACHVHHLPQQVSKSTNMRTQDSSLAIYYHSKKTVRINIFTQPIPCLHTPKYSSQCSENTTLLPHGMLLIQSKKRLSNQNYAPVESLHQVQLPNVTRGMVRFVCRSIDRRRRSTWMMMPGCELDTKTGTSQDDTGWV
jgi:hypothetical protein